ncbi:class I SAM-dependent methyltransferase [Deminuibacter soli]|uniref:Class I SAM-dependent methyltransferase n=1 Tax=Deminuibacter soli TaxID=2291815 RepID=A0A3E1NFA6_9BACT|nr:class I SAM-dependent methyltransferase [Deminuibacter soli]RFM26491.1 class I SAM-dependent methyltransferase [Deminuibacter soli]
MGYISFSMPREIVLQFKDKGNIRNFIETGTYQGGTSFWAARHFEQVATVEIDPAISKATASKPDCPANIRFYVGNSKDVLPEMVKPLTGRSIFWLDGHWCNVTEMGKDMECPLMDEIRALAHLKDAVILIDDARAFLGPLPPPHNNADWPRIDEVFALLKQQYPDNLVTIADDVIYCIPPDLIGVYDADYVAQFERRFGQKNTGLLSRILNKK